MSAVVKNRGRANLPVSTTALWLVLGLAVVFFLVNYGQQLLLAHDLSTKSDEQRLVNSRLKDENSRLKALLQYDQSDKYIEQRAREDLNLRREDEEVLIPVGATPVKDSQSTNRQGNDSGSKALPTPRVTGEEANWLKWLDLFRAPAQ